MLIPSEHNNNISGVLPISDKELGAFCKEEYLSNGTKLVVVERPGTPVCMCASFLSGSYLDPEGKEGTSHFLEHMLVAGTTKFPTKDRLAASIEVYGGEIGASTELDTMRIDATVADPDDFKICSDTLHEMLLEPLFNQKTFETERGAILEELGNWKSNQSRWLWDIYPRLFFQGTKEGRSILGTEESIKNISKEDVIRFYNDNMVSGKLTLFISGGVVIDDVKQLAEKSLLVHKGDNLITEQRELPVNRDKTILIEKYPGNKVDLLFGFRTSSELESEVAALNVISEVLGSGRSGLLNKKLRLEKGLVYNVGVNNSRGSNFASWLIKTSTSKDKLQDVMNIISAEIKRIVETGLTWEEIDFAQKKMTKSLRMELQSSNDWVDWYSTFNRRNGKTFSVYDYTKGILDVTPEITKAVAQKYFKNDKWYLAMCGNVEEGDVKINL